MMNTPHSPYSLCAALDRNAKELPDELALRFLHDGDIGGRVTELTFSAFRKRALTVAAALQEQLQPGARALLLYEGGIEFIIAFYGCLYAGVIAVPTYPPDPQRIHRTLPRLQAIVEDASATLVLCNVELQRAAEPLCAQADRLSTLVWLPSDTLDPAAHSYRPRAIEPTDVAYLQYTSGSTGTPKGVVVTHDNLAWSCQDFLSRWAYDGPSHHVSWLPTFHDLGLIWGLLTPLVGGFPVTFMLPTAFLQRPARWFEAITHFRGTHTAAPNFGYDLVISKTTDERLSQLDLSSLRAAMNAAEPVRKSTLEALTHKFGPVGFRTEALCPCYGLAEATLPVTISGTDAAPMVLAVSAQAIEQHEVVPPRTVADTRFMIGCGQIAPFNRLAIVAPDTHVRLPDGRVGEIWVAGPVIARGYWERPEATAETFENHISGEDDTPWLQTGDLGFLAAGQLFISGRAKDMLIIRGRNLYPQDLEQEIERAHVAIRPGCVAAFPIEVDEEERIGLVAELDPARIGETSAEALLRPLRLAIAESFDVQLYDLALIPPRSIFKTSSGKIQRSRTGAALASGELTVLARWTAPRPTVTSVVQTPLLGESELTARIWGWLKEVPGLLLPDAPDHDALFRELGLDSASAAGISGSLAALLGRFFPPTLLFDFPTLRTLVAHLTHGGPTTHAAAALSPPPTSTVAATESIAVVGIGCRLPGAVDSADAFFALLSRGVDTVQKIPEERWLEPGLHNPAPALQFAALLEHVDQFDAAFFGVSPREANMLDPQQRLLLEVAWEALEDAGQDKNRLFDSATGVFIGLSTNDYVHAVRSSGVMDVHSLTGTISSTAAGRLSHTFGLRGPSMTIDTACSSSLVAVHLACQSLRLGECDMAIVGGANMILAPEVMQMLAKSQALSPDGRSKTFDASANGYVRGEGCGVLVLKRLAEATRDGDQVRACIRGSATNHNAQSTALTVPSMLAQQALLRQALSSARLAPQDIDYVETHGTGTAVGDPIEFDALRAVFGAPTPDGTLCTLGALKTNLGHLEAAAGIAGLIKVITCLQHEAIPGNLHLQTLNPRISLQGTRFRLPNTTVAWPVSARPRRAGVSSFGLSGTNAHVVVEEAPSAVRALQTPTHDASRSYVVPLSAKSPAALSKLAQAYADYLPNAGAQLSDISYSTCCRRTHLQHRLAVIASSPEALARQLRMYAQGEGGSAFQGYVVGGQAPQVVLVFSGQGSQWPGMGTELRQRSSVFRRAVEECAQLFEKVGGFSLLAELDKPADASSLHLTEVAQPALFSIQVGLLAELRAFGIEPALVIGHSIGEVAAAFAAGILSLESACQLVLARGRAMIGLQGQGKMVAAELTEQEAEAALQEEQGRVSVAAINGPRSVVLAGEPAALHRLTTALSSRGVVCRELRVDYAFHSPQMAGAAQVLVRGVRQLAAKPATVPMISTVTGTVVQGPELTAEYWGRNIRQPVRFAEAIQYASQTSGRLFLEVGPHPVLCAEMAAQLSATDAHAAALASLRRNKNEQAQLVSTLAALHVRGVPVRWSADFSSAAKVVPLPSYPWQRERFWITPAKPTSRTPKIASDYYDSVTKLVQDVQGHHSQEQSEGLFLTFAPFAQVVPDFSWLQVFVEPQNYPELVRLMKQQQLQMRQVLFRHVNFPACARALDFGCGFSSDILHLAQQYPHLKLDGYTISAGQAEFGQRRLREKGLDERVQVYCRDSAQDAFPAQYDLVFGFEVAHHIKDKSALFANLRSHLQSQGTLVLADFISHVSFEIEHASSSSFFLTVQQWTELLSSNQLQVQDVVDVSRQVSNFLHDPHFDKHLEQRRQAGADENVLVSFQSYDRLGKLLDRGLASYILLSAKKVADQSVEALRNVNYAALTNLLPYLPSAVGESLERELFLGVEWRPAGRPEVETRPGSAWLVVAQKPETSGALAMQLAAQGIRCVRVYGGSSFKCVGPDEYQLNLSEKAAYQRLLQESFGHTHPCTRVVYLAGLELSLAPSGTAQELGDALVHVSSAAVGLVQALVLHGFRNAPRLYIVTQGVQAVTGSEQLQVAQSPLCGLGKTIALEHPELKCTRLDLDPAVAMEPTTLIREVSTSDREDQVALRGELRYVARLVRAPASASQITASDHSIHSDRSYLITGGLGGLGLELASWLVENGAGCVVLASRSQPTQQGQQRMQELNQSSTRVLCIQADVSDSKQVASLLQQIQSSGFPLAGIVHAAGTLKDQVLLELSEESLRAVFAAKVHGAWNLHQLAPAELDFFVMYSSAAALCGSPGQASYCAANSFLDTLAQQRVHQGKPAMSIQWGPFERVGMAAAQQNRGRTAAGRGVGSLLITEGHRVLQALLRSPRANVGVMRLNTRQWVEAIPSAAALPFFSDLTKQSGSSERLGSQATQLLSSLRVAEEADRLPLLVPYLQQQIGAVLQLEPSRLDTLVPFQSLGMDSLMSLEIRNRLEAGLGVRLPATVLFTYANLGVLSAHILECIGLAAQPRAGTARVMPAGPQASKADAQLAELSDEDLARLAEDLLS